jgi:predicted ferric reductase
MKETSNKLLVCAILLANLACIVGIWALRSGSLLSLGTPSVLISLGRLSGLLAEFFILIQILLVSRFTFVERLFGFDVLNRWHRKLGLALTGAILIHPVLLTLGYSLEHGVPFATQFMDFLLNWHEVLLAIIGLGIIVVVGILSASFFRRRMRYEHWHLAHLLMYVGIVLLLNHQTNFASVSAGWPLYYWLALNYIVFGVIILYRFINPFVRFARFRFVVDRVVDEGGGVNSIYIRGRNLSRFSWVAGQFVHVYFLQKGLWQPHPFSLSVAPNGEHLRISAKALGDYTKKLSELEPGTKVIIEGPFGRFSEAAARGEKFLFLAGGIGITPIRAMIESLSAKGKDFVLLYAARTEKDLVLREELARYGGRQHYILSDVPAPGALSGRIDEEKIKILAPDVRERDVYLCGPPPMMDSLATLLKKLGVPEPQIHFEKFSY